MSLEDAMRQKTGQLVLPLEGRGEATRCQRSGEASTAASGNERPGTDRLVEEVVQRGNAKAALKRVRQNKGSPGVDGMTVDELPEYLAEHWETIREQLLADLDPVLRQVIRQLVHRHPVDAGAAPVLLHPSKRGFDVAAFNDELQQLLAVVS